MRDWYRALPFRFAPDAETLVIGPGGGSDVLVALGSGSRKVTVVEMNPLMIEFVRHYGERAGNLYDRPDVEVIQSEGRNFISRTDRKFDVIFLGFVDTWASVASGGLSLSENYLYTTQALAGLLRPSHRRRCAGDHAMGRGHSAAGFKFGGSARRRGSLEASRRSAREAERVGRSLADDFHAAQDVRSPKQETAEIMGWTLADPVHRSRTSTPNRRTTICFAAARRWIR